MDISRGVLDNLMGRDRNMPKNSKNARDHYSNSDVCKPFLVCFCFNTLFPNTIYDQGPCNKRHDIYLKTMFDSDLNRSEHEKQYIKECIHWIEKRLVDAEQKAKKNILVIDNKTSYTTERPKQVLDRIMAIEEEIEKTMQQAQLFGENGQIDDSARCLEEVERLRDRRREIQLMGDNMLTAGKQQKICDICGAIQTINDTDKRIQTHLEGKIHQGFLKLRNEIESLKIRLEIIQARTDGTKPKDKEREKEKEREKQKEREREKQKERQKGREMQAQIDLHKQMQTSKQAQNHDNNKSSSRSHSHKKKKEKEKSRKEKMERKDKKERSSERHNKHDRDHSYERSRDRHRKDKDTKKKHRKEHSKSYEKVESRN